MEPVPPTAVRLAMAPEVEQALASQARGRRLLIDWFATRCCSNVAVGDVDFRWQAPDRQIEPGAVRVEGITGFEVWLRPELVGLFARARARVILTGFGRWRHPSVVVEDGDAWIDFFAACPMRSTFGR